jgi:hypothetical protein
MCMRETKKKSKRNKKKIETMDFISDVILFQTNCKWNLSNTHINIHTFLLILIIHIEHQFYKQNSMPWSLSWTDLYIIIFFSLFQFRGFVYIFLPCISAHLMLVYWSRCCRLFKKLLFSYSTQVTLQNFFLRVNETIELIVR